MGEGLYLTDAYLKECRAQVRRSGSDGVYLDSTVFYPAGGGQPSDSGELRAADGRHWVVTGAAKGAEGILHNLESGEPPEPGLTVQAVLDWPRRYSNMRHHTALHILSGVVFRRFGSGITGGQIYADRARMDFDLPEFTPGLASELVAEMNAVVRRALPVHVRFISRREFESDPSFVRVARNLMPEVEEVRLIDIEGFDVQADGGTHVRSTSEVGEVALGRIENKGARNKRLYLTLGPPTEAASSALSG
jgi:misacylated tRNA(Ala) deacylase